MEWWVIVLLKFLAFGALTILIHSHPEGNFQFQTPREVQAAEIIINSLMVDTNHEASFLYITVQTWYNPNLSGLYLSILSKEVYL
jgi:hypothetical protein